jgi:predicted pyridoxine 5'-phosphate oxidase superfamily flavin-nucleotide-binding protein
MIKRIIVGVIAAGAISVPLAAAASADPTGDNPGVPGNLGVSPGCQFSAVARAEPGLIPKAIDADGTPGNFTKQLAPGNTG